MIGTASIKGFAKVMAHGTTPFYASELGLNGGTIGALSYYRVIAPTGNTKEVTFPHPYDDNRLIKSTVCEWVLRKDRSEYRFFYDWFIEDLHRVIKDMRETLALYDEVFNK
jgi:hypothetical protein